jgi:AP-1 complex subunit mu
VVYAPEKSAFVWKIKQLGGGRDYLMRAHFGLPSVKSGTSHMLCVESRWSVDELDKRAPISVKFEIPYFTVSGIQVRYLKVVEKSGYQAVSFHLCFIDKANEQLPWVRYITQNGDDFVSSCPLHLYQS